MYPRFQRVLRLTFAAALVLSFNSVHAIPKAAEDAGGTVEIVADVPRPKASAKTSKSVSKQSAPSAKSSTKKSAKVGKPKAKKPARGKK